ncbi:manganese catalase family protein [Hymenobacter pini]|uniref:manganese catalase family protein n=1 Tax=Hymenobacter pini TaxID=2880879 RepID=UPI001CF160A0|nr:manganese catalase family protein [Hymenobacter pini]MCA8832656.1 manganese catalase family protein [Hymenobacter pini]
MFYHDRELQYKVRVDKPNPAFARMLQQAIGGIEGEIRVCLQYLFQAWGSRGPEKYRNMLLETGTEEISHIEMLATAVALNLEGAPTSLQEEFAGDKVVGAILGGMDPRHILSSGMAALATDTNGVPFNGSWIVGSGNIVADMYSNVAAEATGRTLATRLWHMTDDAGMKDFLSFLIARDTMHQQQWLAVIEENGGLNALPVPNSFPQSEEVQGFNYAFVSTYIGNETTTGGRWTQGPSLDGKGEFHVEKAAPLGGVPKLAPPVPSAFAQKEQMTTVDSLIGTVTTKIEGALGGSGGHHSSQKDH